MKQFILMGWHWITEAVDKVWQLICEPNHNEDEYMQDDDDYYWW